MFSFDQDEGHVDQVSNGFCGIQVSVRPRQRRISAIRTNEQRIVRLLASWHRLHISVIFHCGFEELFIYITHDTNRGVEVRVEEHLVGLDFESTAPNQLYYLQNGCLLTHFMALRWNV